MAVLKSWYVMLFYIIITLFLQRSYGDEKEEIVNTLLNVQGLANGYGVLKFPFDRESLNKRSLVNLQKLIDNLYNHLECGYFYSTRSHIKLTRHLISKNTKNVVTSETIQDFSFDIEATMMIDSFLDREPDQLHDLWSLLVYTRQMYSLFDGIMIMNSTDAEALGRAEFSDDIILSVIEKRIANIRCALDNGFNMARSSGEDNVDAMNAIKENKQLLHTIFYVNRAKRLLQASTSKSQSFGSLWLFRDKSAAESFFNDFLASDSDRFEIRFPKLDSENNLTGIAPLGQYQNRVIGTLKILTLQITLSYSRRLIHPEFLENAQKFYNGILTPLQHLLVSEDDADFHGFSDNYKNWYNGDKKLSTAFFFVSINAMIGTIMTENDLPEIKVIGTDDRDKTLKDVFEIGIRFVERIQKDIGEIPIRAVLKFLNIINKSTVKSTDTD